MVGRGCVCYFGVLLCRVGSGVWRMWVGWEFLRMSKNSCLEEKRKEEEKKEGIEI